MYREARKTKSQSALPQRKWGSSINNTPSHHPRPPSSVRTAHASSSKGPPLRTPSRPESRLALSRPPSRQLDHAATERPKSGVRPLSGRVFMRCSSKHGWVAKAYPDVKASSSQPNLDGDFGSGFLDSESLDSFFDDEFEDNEEVEKLGNLLSCNNLGVETKVKKQDWVSGDVNLPRFHCPRCRDHWYGITDVPCDEELARLIREGLWKTGNTANEGTQETRLSRGGADSSKIEGQREVNLSNGDSQRSKKSRVPSGLPKRNGASWDASWDWKRKEEDKKKKKRITFKLDEDNDEDDDGMTNGQSGSGRGLLKGGVDRGHFNTGADNLSEDPSDQSGGRWGGGGGDGMGNSGDVTAGGAGGKGRGEDHDNSKERKCRGRTGKEEEEGEGGREEEVDKRANKMIKKTRGSKGIDADSAKTGNQYSGDINLLMEQREKIGAMNLIKDTSQSGLLKGGGGGGNHGSTTIGNTSTLEDSGKGSEVKDDGCHANRSTPSCQDGVFVGEEEREGLTHSSRTKSRGGGGGDRTEDHQSLRPRDHGKKIRKSGGYMRAVSPTSSEWGDPLHARSFLSSTAVSRTGSSSNLLRDHNEDLDFESKSFLPPIVVQPIHNPPLITSMDHGGPQFTRPWTFSYH